MPVDQILVVEDELIVAKDIQNTLEKLGYNVPSIASSGEEAIKKAGEIKPDLILMDIVLKGPMDGVETANKIRAEFNIPVIYVTAYADEKTLSRAEVTEPFGYLIKPFEERELNSTIKMALYKQKIERRLKDSEERYRQLIELIPVAMLVCDENKIVYINSATIDLFGAASTEEIIGRSIADFIHPNQHEIVNSRIHTISSGSETIEPVILKAIQLNGQIKEVEMIAIPIEYMNKKRIQIVFRDITEHRQMEGALRESEEQYRNLVERANDGIVIVQDGIIKFVNHKLEEITGFLGKDVVDNPITNYIHPDEMPKVLERYNARMAGKDVEPIYESAIIHKNGDKIFVELNAGIINYKDKPADLVILRDITERKQAEQELKKTEEKFKLLSNNMSDVIFWVTPNFKIIDVTPSVEQFSGYKPEELIGKPFNELNFLTQKSLNDTFENLKRKMAGEVPPFTIYEFIAKDGTQRFAEVISNPVMKDGSFVELIAIARDITERKRMENELLEERNLATRYLNVLGHDINNFNQAIMSLNELVLLKPDFPKKYQKYIKKSMQQVKEISNKIYDINKLFEVRNTELSIEKIDLYPLITNAIEQITNTYSEKNLKIKNSIMKDKILVNGNNLLTNVFRNILVNAIRYGSNDGVKIEISVAKIEDENLWQLEFKDQGSSIPTEIRDIFNNQPSVGEKAILGQELGLMFIFELVNKFNGSVQIEDRIEGKPDMGNNFVVQLPRYEK